MTNTFEVVGERSFRSMTGLEITEHTYCELDISNIIGEHAEVAEELVSIEAIEPTTLS